MPTALDLRLTDTQRERLHRYLFARAADLEGQMRGSDWWAKRERYEQVLAGKREDRQLNDQAPIFKLKDRSLMIVRSVVKFLEARICRDLFGSSPWFKVVPQGAADAPVSEQIEPHASWKLREAEARSTYKAVVKRALQLGECPVLTTWRVEEEIHDALKVVLVDVETGEAVLTADGGYIFPEDELTEAGREEETEGLGEEETWSGGEEETTPVDFDVPSPPLPVSSSPLLPLSPSPRLVFAKAPEVEFWPVSDPETGEALPGGRHEFREQLIEERYVTYQGLDITLCEWKDVYWPLNVANFQDADMIVYRRQARVSELRARWGTPRKPEAEGEGAQEGESEAAGEEEEMWRKVAVGNVQPQTEAKQAKDERGEPTVVADTEDPVVAYLEVYFDFDVFGDGTVRRCFAILHEETQTVIYQDYRATISPRARKPLDLIAVNRVEGRAYGVGEYEMFEEAERCADEDLCKLDYNDELRANPPRIWNPQRTVEGQANPNLKVQSGMTLTSNDPRWGPSDIFAFANVPDLGERTWEKMQLRMQLIQAESGVTNAAQAAVSNLPGNDLATGINAMAEVASILHLHLLDELKDGFGLHLGYAIEVLYFRQDRDETYQYLEGKAEAVLALADAQALRELPMNVEILLTRAKRQEDREAAMAAIPVFTQFFTLPTHAQRYLLPAYVQAASGFGFHQPEQFFPTAEELTMQMEAEAAAAQAMAEQEQADVAPGGEAL